jgi:hypothetical protein
MIGRVVLCQHVVFELVCAYQSVDRSSTVQAQRRRTLTSCGKSMESELSSGQITASEQSSEPQSSKCTFDDKAGVPYSLARRNVELSATFPQPPSVRRRWRELFR